MKHFVAALAMGIAVPGLAGARDAAVAAAPVPGSEVEQLVALLLPEDAITRVAARAFDAGMDQEIASDASLKAIYDGNPGLRNAVSTRLQAEFAALLAAELPALRTEIGTILTTELTAAEIADTLTFFASPTGAKLRAEVYASMGSDPDQSSEQMQQAALASVMAKMTADDYPALMAFGASTAAQKMGAINPKIAAASEAWATRLVDANKPKMEAIALEVTRGYAAKKGN